MILKTAKQTNLKFKKVRLYTQIWLDNPTFLRIEVLL